MGGLRKTIIARIVYEDEMIKGHFNCRAWITVSQSYNMEQLLKMLTKQIFKDSELAKYMLFFI